MKRASQLLGEEPTQWGLRGDPFLWREMKARLDSVAMPEASEDLVLILHSALAELTGNTLGERGPIFVERYNRGGMSSGMVCQEFWNTAIDLAISRYHATKGRCV